TGAVGHGRAGNGRTTVGAEMAGREEPAHREVVEVVPGVLRLGTVLPVAARRAVHDAWIRRCDRVVTDAERVGHTGTETFDEDVDTARDAKERLPAGVGLQIDEHAPHPALSAVRMEGRFDQ